MAGLKAQLLLDTEALCNPQGFFCALVLIEDYADFTVFIKNGGTCFGGVRVVLSD